VGPGCRDGHPESFLSTFRYAKHNNTQHLSTKMLRDYKKSRTALGTTAPDNPRYF
jgi:hypothetical protein